MDAVDSLIAIGLAAPQEARRVKANGLCGVRFRVVIGMAGPNGIGRLLDFPFFVGLNHRPLDEPVICHAADQVRAQLEARQPPFVWRAQRQQIRPADW